MFNLISQDKCPLHLLLLTSHYASIFNFLVMMLIIYPVIMRLMLIPGCFSNII